MSFGRYLIDRSVRMAGNRVRITAQLLQANDGISLWTENYDRELTDLREQDLSSLAVFQLYVFLLNVSCACPATFYIKRLPYAAS